MRPAQINRFFDLLNRELKIPAEVILTGASAGALMGNIRPSMDIDFEIRPHGKISSGKRKRLEGAIQRAARSAGVAVNYAEDISHWSMVSYLDYRRTAEFYKKFGKLEVKIMAPEYWTIGKMARFLELDIQDMVKIIKKKKLDAGELIRLWQKVLGQSSLSLGLSQFRDHVVYFLRKYGRKLWGKQFPLERSLQEFQ